MNYAPGVTRQVVGVHSGNLVTHPDRMAVDNHDLQRNNQSQMPHEFECTNLVHFTENDFAESIGVDTDQFFSFRAFPWRESSETDWLQLIWFSPLPPRNWRSAVNVDMNWSIGNSPAIEEKSLCGPVGFVINWTDVLKQYAFGRQRIVEDIELRNVGTFLYRKEIMFSVLVCMKGDLSVDRFPVITDETDAFSGSSQSDSFIWKVYSTGYWGQNVPPNVHGTWDHLAFCFNCPTSNLNIQPQVCSITEKKSVLTNIDRNLEKIAKKERKMK